MGRLPIPESDKKLRTIFYCTIAEGIELGKRLEQLRRAPYEVDSPVVIDTGLLGGPQPLPAHNVITPRPSSPSGEVSGRPMSSPRECSVCGKDYDGDLYTSCPHPHEVNPGAKKR